jgi:hypothetical protein
VYPTDAITFTSTETDMSGQTMAYSNISGSEDHTKALSISKTATIDVTKILPTEANAGGSITVSTNVTHPIKTNISGGGSSSISGILLYNKSERNTGNTGTNSLDVHEDFRGETWRLKAGNYTLQTDFTANPGPAWVSTDALDATNHGLLVWDEKLVAPTEGSNGGNFGAIANAAAGNPNYSGLTSGTKVFYRKFRNTSGGSKYNFNLELDCETSNDTTLIGHSDSFGTNSKKIKVYVRRPESNGFSTHWLDTTADFVSSAQLANEGAGCLVGVLDSSVPATNEITFGDQGVQNQEYIVIKVVADASWTGNLTKIKVTWL